VADAEKAAQINQPVCHRQLVPTFYILDVHKEPNYLITLTLFTLS
jgi:hypothetical protein